MIKIKISEKYNEFYRQSPNEELLWGDCKFYINEDIKECDFWFVFEGLCEIENVKCPKENVFLITAEPESIKHYKPWFLMQFSGVITPRQHLKHKNVISCPQLLPWFVGKINHHGESGITYTKDYNYFKNNNVNKTKTLSIVCSNKQFTEGHKKRYEFAQKLKAHFGDEIDVFGGDNKVDDKWDAIADYKYHIAIENESSENYFSEKLTDTYLAESYPIYYGCTNVDKYFSKESFTYIDINDFDKSVKIIEDLIKTNAYENSINEIKQAKELVLDKYNLFPFLAEFCANREYSQKKCNKLIMPENVLSLTYKKIINKFRKK